MTTKLVSVRIFSILAVVAALLFTFSTAAQAQFTVTGKVVSINESSKIITIEPTMKDPKFGAGPVSFALTRTDPYDRDTVRTVDIRDMSDRSMKLGDIHQGDWVTITYHQESTGQYVVQGIMVGTPGMVPRGEISGTRQVPATQYPDQYRNEQYRTYPQGRSDLAPLSITGKVIAIDKFAKTFTLDPSHDRLAADRAVLGLRTFALDKNSIVLIGNERREFNDLTIGDHVTVSYRHESTGKILADHITLVPVYPGVVSGPQASTLMPDRMMSRDTLRRDHMGNTFAAESSPFSIVGKVVAVDRDARTITVDSSDFRDAYSYNKSAAGVTTFVLDKDIAVLDGKKALGLSDIHVGDTVSVNYHQASDGNIIADEIAINPPLFPFPEERG